MERVAMELGMASQFDYQVVNDNLEHAIAEVDKLVVEHTSQEQRV
jgi:guanylate kinase